jgi:hypothetical protein
MFLSSYFNRIFKDCSKIHVIFVMLIGFSIFILINYYVYYEQPVNKQFNIGRSSDNFIQSKDSNNKITITSTIITKTTEKTTTTVNTTITIRNSTENVQKPSKNETNPKCPMIPPNLKTKAEINQTVYNETQIIEILQLENIEIELGGRWKPANCISNNKVN